MSNISQELPSRAQLPTIWRGVVSQAPLNFQSPMHVSIPDMNPDLDIQDIRWQARDNMTLPEAGDECLILFDNTREPWVPIWWPADKSPSIIYRKYADGAPPNPVEGDIWIAEDPDVSNVQTMYTYHSGAWEPVSYIPARIGVAGNYAGSLNNQDSGWCSFTPTTIGAPAGTYGTCLTVKSADWYGRQIAFDYSSAQVWQRNRTSGTTWAAWWEVNPPTWDSGWRNLSLVNTWYNYANMYATARYRKLSSGLVLVQGLVSRSGGPPGGGSIIGTLPNGYIPNLTQITAQACANGVARIDFIYNGDIQFSSYQFGSGAEGWCTINASFYADQ